MTTPIVCPLSEEFNVIEFLAGFTDAYEADLAEGGVREDTLVSLVEALNQSLLDTASLATLLSDPYARRVLEVTPLEFSLNEDATSELRQKCNAETGIQSEMINPNAENGELASIRPVRFYFENEAVVPLVPGAVYVRYSDGRKKFTLNGTEVRRPTIWGKGYEDMSAEPRLSLCTSGAFISPFEITQITLAQVGEQN